MAQISNEYAEALFALAAESDERAEDAEALELVSRTVKENPEYIDFLASPDIPVSERTAAIDDAFGTAVPEHVVSFLSLLCERGRIRTLDDCISDYKKLNDAAAGMSEAKVVSAVELSTGERTALQKKLEKLCGHAVELKCSVDPSLLGGVTVTVDGKVIDGSVKRKLHELKGAMYR